MRPCADEATLTMVDDAAREVAGRASGLSAAAVEAALDPVQAVEARGGIGGTAVQEIARMVARMRDTLAGDEAVSLTRRQGIEGSNRERLDFVRALTEGMVGKKWQASP
jgi:hypothetical protein